MKNWGFLLAAAGFSLSAAPAGAVDMAWELNNPGPYSNGSWAFGDVFTVGNQNLQVFGLGAFDANLDGFVTSGGIQVGLYNELTSALLASTNVLSSDTLIGNYRFGQIGPVTLSAGSQYRVVAVSGGDLYNVNSGTPNLVNSAITWDRYGYCSSTSLQSCNQFTGTERSWMANMLLSPISGAVPEPATWAMLLLGFGLVGGAMRGRKQGQPKVRFAF